MLKRGSVGIVVILLLAMLFLLASSDNNFWNLLTGKTQLTQQGSNLASSLTTQGKIVVAWSIGAFILVTLAALAPEVGVALTSVLFVGVLLSHPQLVENALNGLNNLTKH